MDSKTKKVRKKCLQKWETRDKVLRDSHSGESTMYYRLTFRRDYIGNYAQQKAAGRGVYFARFSWIITSQPIASVIATSVDTFGSLLSESARLIWLGSTPSSRATSLWLMPFLSIKQRICAEILMSTTPESVEKITELERV